MASESQSRTALAYRNRVSSRIDHWLFVIVFVIGSGGIIVLKERGYEQWMVTSFPVAMMFVYALYVTTTRRYLLREDQAGDNLYYLGFLYTLVSLAYSLFFFAGEEESTQKIIGNFGVALATTIVGLALRVLFNQMREDPVEIEREARLDLGEAVSRLKAELDTSVIELNSFRRATAQSLAEGMAEISDKSNTILESHSARLTDLVEQVTEKLDKGFSTLKENQKELNAASRRTVNAVDRLAQRVEEISVPSDLIERKVAPALEALAEGARKISAHSQAQTENTEKLTALIESAVESSRLLDQRLAALVKDSEDQRQGLASEIEGLRGALGSLRGAVQDSLEGWKDGAGQQQAILTKLTDSAEAHLKMAETHRNGLEEELTKSRALVSELHEALVSMTRLMIDRLDGS